MQQVDISVCSHVTHKEKSEHNRGVSILALIVHTEHFMSISSAKKALKWFFFRFKWNSAKRNLVKTRSFQANRWRNKELKPSQIWNAKMLRWILNVGQLYLLKITLTSDKEGVNNFTRVLQRMLLE